MWKILFLNLFVYCASLIVCWVDSIVFYMIRSCSAEAICSDGFEHIQVSALSFLYIHTLSIVLLLFICNSLMYIVLSFMFSAAYGLYRFCMVFSQYFCLFVSIVYVFWVYFFVFFYFVLIAISPLFAVWHVANNIVISLTLPHTVYDPEEQINILGVLMTLGLWPYMLSDFISCEIHYYSQAWHIAISSQLWHKDIGHKRSF